ncbi:MAG: 4-(cytidine 5'-diphospho)-2-C-methyl-D-erythritol kinase [Actinomycetota bacterium]|nr:4-(cytidine 5'-diphospho)-2-C-methyl-D-erythritol kinase [Actinomycetota bacterium]
MTVTETAYAKVNLVLRVGPPRPDGLHPLCSLFASLALADAVCVEASEADAVVCPGVVGQNLAARAAVAFRAAVPELPPLRITIDKRIPVAAGLGGGSADAAAVLRAANRLTGAGLEAAELRRLAAELGSDVPSQVKPGHWLVAGVGERLEPVELRPMQIVLVPQPEGLSTAAVYAELDRLRAASGRPIDEALDPEPVRRLARAPLDELAAGLENDLQPAAMSLRPQLERPLESLMRAGALAAQVTGSGPAAFGVFADRSAAVAAASEIEGAIVTEARLC